MSKMSKSEVYSWRVTPALKAELEAAARAEKVPLSVLLETIAYDWLRGRSSSTGKADMKRRRAALMACAGIIQGSGESATNERVRQVMGRYLEAKYGWRRPR
jgi:hypothetical protein